MAGIKSTGGADAQPSSERNMVMPPSHVNNTHSTNSGAVAYANDDYPPLEEDEPPMTPSAANAMVEETPESRRIRLEMEENVPRNKALLVATTSNRFHVSVFQEDVLEDPNFSFMPAHQHFISTHHLNGRPPTCTIQAAQETGGEEHGPSGSTRPYRDSELRTSPKVDLMSDQLYEDTLEENEVAMDDEALALRHESPVVQSEPQQQKQYDDSVTTAQSHASRSTKDQNAGDEEDYEHNGPYNEHVDSTTAINDVQPNYATGPATSSPTQTARYFNEDADKTDHFVDLTHSSPDREGLRTKRVSRIPGTTGVGGAPNHHARVSKAPRRRHPHPGAHPNIHRHANGRPLQQPSEEDLLFLLMSRVRKYGQVRKRLDYLELQNGRLLQEKEQSGAELQEAVNARDEYAQEYSSLTQDLESFKEKYYKLKKWALETNKDCEELQKQAANFERSLVDLTKDRNQLHAQLQDAQSTSDTVSEQMANVRGEICEVKLMAEERLAKVNQLSGLLIGKDDKLKSETLQCKKLELQIIHLDLERNKHNLRMCNEQQVLNQTLQTMSEKLQTLQNDGAGAKSAMDLISASLSRIQATMDNDLSTKADISSLLADVASRVDSFDDTEASICEKLEQAIANLKNALQKDVVDQAEKILSAVQSGNGPLAEVNASLSSLEQKAGRTGEMIKLLQETKSAAEKNPKVVADNLTKALGPEREESRKKVEALEIQIGELTAKWERACADRETYKQEREQEKAEHQAEAERIREEGNIEGRLQGREEGRREGKEEGILEGREQGRQKGRQERDTERDAEHQAEVDDLLALLIEAMQEQNCLQSELSKAEDYLQQAEKQMNQAQEQDDIEMADYCYRIECRLRDLQDKIELGLEQRADVQGVIESLNAIQSQLRRDLKASRGETTIAIKEQYALHDEIVDLERRLDWTEDNLEQATGHLKQTTDELKVFSMQQPAVEQLKKDFQSQQQEVDAKSQEVRILRKEAEKQRSRCAELEKQARERGRLAEENNALNRQLKVAQKDTLLISDLRNELERKNIEVRELKTALAASQQEAKEKDDLAQEVATTTTRLEELEKQNSVMPELQKRVQQKETKIAELEAALESSQQQAQEKNKLTEENAAVKKQLRELQKENSALAEVQTKLQEKNVKVADLETALSLAREEASKIDGLQKANNSLKENLVSLSSDLEQLNEECAEIGPLKDAVQAKDDELTELHKQLASASGQTEELEKLREELQRKEDEHAVMQQQILSLEGALSNAKLDRETLQSPPQRRVADRSGRTNVSPNAQFKHSHPDAGRNDIGLSHADTLASSAHTTVVPETQPEIPESVPVDYDSLIPLPDRQLENSESELSPIPSEDEDNHIEDDIGRDITNSQAHSRGQGYVSPVLEAVETGPPSQAPFERSPSSSYSSQGEQMLLDQVSQGHPGDPAGAIRGIVMPRNRLESTQIPSPRRLRSGSQVQGDAETPEPSTQSGRNRSSTPAIRREQYQPNSAAKRRIDPAAEDTVLQENTKKLKRRPENVGVKGRQPRTPTQSSKQTPPRGPASWRTSGTVVGTNAPAPGKSQRTSKAARKGSRQDKYTSRFAADA